MSSRPRGGERPEPTDRGVSASFLGTTMDLSAEEDDSLAEEQRQRELAQLAIKFGRYKEPLVQLLLQEAVRKPSR